MSVDIHMEEDVGIDENDEARLEQEVESQSIEAEKKLSSLLKSQLNSMTIQEYIDRGISYTTFDQQPNQHTNAIKPLHSPPMPSIQTWSDRPSPEKKQRAESDQSHLSLPPPLQPQAHSRSASSVDTSVSPDNVLPSALSSASSSSSSPPSAVPVVKLQGRGKGRQTIHIDYSRSFVSQILELTQAMRWPTATFVQIRVG